MRWILPRRVDPRWAKAKEALVVLATVAAEDSDYATRANGVGFNRADSTKGHALAQLDVQSVLQDDAAYADVMGMAARYRRQALKIGQLRLL